VNPPPDIIVKYRTSALSRSFLLPPLMGYCRLFHVLDTRARLRLKSTDLGDPHVRPVSLRPSFSGLLARFDLKVMTRR